MNKLPPSAAGLLEQVRQRDRAHQVDLDATLQQLHATLPFAAVGPASAPSSDAGIDALGSIDQPPSLSPPSLAPPAGVGALSGGALLSGKAVKLILATLALGGAIGGASLMGAPAQHADSGTHATPTLAPRSSPTSSVTSAKQDESAPREAAASAPARLREDQRAPGRSRTPRAVRPSSNVETAAGAAALRAVAASAMPPPPLAAEPHRELASRATVAEQGVESELDLIDAALAQLRAGSAGDALTLLQRHAERYPRGRFRTEREGLRVLALCENGELAPGRDARARFLRSAGDTPIAAQVRLACAEKKAER